MTSFCLLSEVFPHLRVLDSYRSYNYEKITDLYYGSLPGQGRVLQGRSCREEPGQALPPFRGDGFVQPRVRCCLPVPQSVLQAPQELQVDQPPLTKRKRASLVSVQQDDIEKTVHVTQCKEGNEQVTNLKKRVNTQNIVKLESLIELLNVTCTI